MNISEYFYEKRLTTLWIMTLNFLSLKKNREVRFHKQGKAGCVAYNSSHAVKELKLNTDCSNFSINGTYLKISHRSFPTIGIEILYHFAQ